MNQISQPIYNIPSTVTFFDAKVENNLGYIYGLQIENNTADIVKIIAGNYTEDGVLSSFFNFKDYKGNSVDPFNNNYPDSKSYNTQCELFYICKLLNNQELLKNQELFYDCNTKLWNTNRRCCSFFFTEESLSGYLDKTPISDVYQVKSCWFKIKNIINNNMDKFPVLSGNSFIFDDCLEYSFKQELTYPTNDQENYPWYDYLYPFCYKQINLNTTNYGFKINITKTISVDNNVNPLTYNTVQCTSSFLNNCQSEEDLFNTVATTLTTLNNIITK